MFECSNVATEFDPIRRQQQLERLNTHRVRILNNLSKAQDRLELGSKDFDLGLDRIQLVGV